MRKEIFRTLLDLALAITFLLCSIPIWNAYAAKMPEIIETDNNLTFNSGALTGDAIFTINGTKKNLKETELTVQNYNNKTKNGKLVFKYSKESSLDYRNLNVVLNGEIRNLTSFLMSSDKSYYIFILDNIELAKNEAKKYTFGLWIDENLGKNVFNKEFTYCVETI